LPEPEEVASGFVHCNFAHEIVTVAAACVRAETTHIFKILYKTCKAGPPCAAC